DSRSIPAGSDYAKELLERLHRCGVLLVVIGPRWLTITNEAGHRRIDDPRDWTRREIAAAFKAELQVIPVLIDQGRLPSAPELPEDIAGLARRQYLALRRRYARIDLEFLIQRIIEADKSLGDGAVRPYQHDGALPFAGKQSEYVYGERREYARDIGGAVSGWVPVEDAVRDPEMMTADV